MPLKHTVRIANIQKDFGRFRKNYPRFAGTIGVSFFKDNFKKQGFINSSLEKWKPRKQKDSAKNRRAILVKTGRLRRSIRITNTTSKSVSIGTSVPYAKIHNEGGEIKTSARIRSHKRRTKKGTTTVKAHNRNIKTKIPKRQFAGNSAGLNKRLHRQTIRRLAAILNP